MIRCHLILAATLLTSACAATTDSPISDPDPAGEIIISEPASGDMVVVGTTQRIEWDPPPGVETVNIVADGGPTPINIAQNVPNTGSFDWTVKLESDASLVAPTVGSFHLYVFASGEPAIGAGLPIHVAALAGLRWNGQAEEYTWIDPTTGTQKVVGTVGDLATLPWPRPATTDATTGHLYVVGQTAAMAPKLYTLDLRTGALLSSVGLASLPSTIVAHDGELLALRYNETTQKEEINRLDPLTGVETAHGTLGDLAGWLSQTAVTSTGRMFALGVDASQLGKIYTVDLATGSVVDQAPTTLDGAAIDNLGGLGLNASGMVSAFRWNEATHTEQFVRVDPHTGVATVLGAVADLQAWSYATAFNPTSGDVYAFGTDGTREKLYVVDAASGSVTGVRTMTSSPMTAMLVY